jgi:hypothetical protein
VKIRELMLMLLGYRDAILKRTGRIAAVDRVRLAAGLMNDGSKRSILRDGGSSYWKARLGGYPWCIWTKRTAEILVPIANMCLYGKLLSC